MRRAFSLLEVLIGISVVLVLAALGVTLFGRRAPERPNQRLCQSNLREIGLGFLQYVQDYDGRFPPALVTPSTGWADVLQPYLKQDQLFQCPSARTLAASRTDYFYNRRLARVPRQKIQFRAQTVLCGDGWNNASPWASILQLQPNWAATSTSPSRRHQETANYLFVDGRVKALTHPAIKSTFSPQGLSPTFAIR